MTTTHYTIKDNNISNTHSFYSPSLGTSILVNDDVFNDIRNEEIEPELSSCYRVFLTSILVSDKLQE